MIPYANERFSKENEKKFALTISDYHNNWKYYYTQYSKVYEYLLGIANEKQYQMNCQHMSFMFIFRHTVELMLKYIASEKGIEPQHEHNLKKLANDIDTDFHSLIQSLPHLFIEGDGAMFRYDTSIDDNLYLGTYNVLEVYLDCQVFVQFTKNYEKKYSLYPIRQDIDINDKRLKSELSFYTHECRGLGGIRSHYDTTIDLLVQGVINGHLSVNGIYLPLFFLLRHGIELALKDNLQDLGNKIPTQKQKKIREIHSIEQLYNILFDFIKPAIDKIPQDDPFKAETESLIQGVAILKKCIHNLDVQSKAFRFPNVVNPLVLKRNSLIESLKLYYATDAFLTNAVNVLLFAGYLEVGDDKLADFYY